MSYNYNLYAFRYNNNKKNQSGRSLEMNRSAAKNYTVPEAARAMRYTTKYIYDLIYSGRIEATKMAGRWRIPISEVEARLKKRGE
jgi:excisionase family DNA binding protein